MLASQKAANNNYIMINDQKGHMSTSKINKFSMLDKKRSNIELKNFKELTGFQSFV